MNGLERDFEGTVLMPLRLAGKIVSHDFECVRLRLADKTWYTTDFLAQRVDGTVDAIEVKGGHWEDDARLKWKAAADRYPLFRFFAVTRKGGAWYVEPAFIQDRADAQLYGALRDLFTEGVGGLADVDRLARRVLPKNRKDV